MVLLSKQLATLKNYSEKGICWWVIDNQLVNVPKLGSKGEIIELFKSNN